MFDAPGWSRGGPGEILASRKGSIVLKMEETPIAVHVCMMWLFGALGWSRGDPGSTQRPNCSYKRIDAYDVRNCACMYK